MKACLSVQAIVRTPSKEEFSCSVVSTSVTAYDFVLFRSGKNVC